MSIVLKSAEWSKTWDNEDFRILVVDVCDECRTPEAHAMEIVHDDGTESVKCMVCSKDIITIQRFTVTFAKMSPRSIEFCNVRLDCHDTATYKTYGLRFNYLSCNSHLHMVLNETHVNANM